MQSRGAIISVVSNPSFRALWIGQMCSQLAVNMLLFFIGLILYEKTASNAAVSAVFLAYGLPAVVFGMVAGVVVDHVNRKTTLILCDVVRALLLVPLFLLFHNIAVVYLFVCVHAIISQFYVPAEAPLIPQLVPAGELVTANSIFSFTYYTSMAVGFVLAGPLLRYAGQGGGMAMIAGLFLCAAASVSRIPDQKRGGAFARISRYPVSYVFSRVRDELARGIAYVSEVPALRDALVLLTGTQIILALLGVLGPGFADRVLGIDVSHASTLVVGPVVLGIVAGAVWVGNTGFRINKEWLIRTGILSAGIILMILSVAARISRTIAVPTPVFFLLFFFLGAANSFLDVPANSLLQDKSAGEMRGRVYGLLTATVGGLGILPVVAGGFLADTIGVGKVLLALGAIVTLYGVLRMRYTTRVLPV